MEEKEMVKLLTVDHTKFYVENLDKVVDFYVKKLDFYVEEKNEELNYVILKNKEGIGIDLEVPKDVKTLTRSSEHCLGFTHIGFRVSNVQESYDELVKKGVKFRREPRLNPVNGRTLAFFADPEGNVLHLTD